MLFPQLWDMLTMNIPDHLNIVMHRQNSMCTSQSNAISQTKPVSHQRQKPKRPNPSRIRYPALP